MKIIKHKKGELTTQQIVMLIILVTSFAIILLFLFRLNLGEVSNKEICHNSVVLKGKSVISGNLDCKTNYLCISGGGECEGINPTTTKKINLNDEISDEDEIIEAIADEMVDCWWMFGEGKVDYEGEDWKGYHCAICSSVKFDENLKENEISYDNLFEYLIKTKKSDSQNFYQYLYPYFPKLDDLLNNFGYLSERRDKNLDLTQSFSIVTGLNPNWPDEDSIIPVYFVKTSDIDVLNCDVYDITKA